MKVYLRILLLSLFNASTLRVFKAANAQSFDNISSTETQRKQSALRIAKAYLEVAKDTNAALEESRLLLSGTFSSDALEDILSQAEEETAEKFRSNDSEYVDRFIHGLHETVLDEDCMSREFDVQDDGYDFEEAAMVFQKCKLLVLRNVFDEKYLSDYKEKVTDFIHGLNRGWISPFGKTNYEEPYYLGDHVGKDRWEIILPKELATEPDIVMNKNIMEILQDDGILGEDLVLLYNEAFLSGIGAGGQEYHKDETYLFKGTLGSHGFGGHDLPSYSVSVFVPMLNLTADHGPTEFCMGSSHMDNVENIVENFQAKDPSLIEDGSLFQEYIKGYTIRSDEDGVFCPPQMWRTAVLNFGDIVLFDWQLAHRGGPNTSSQLRTLLGLTYTRPWYKDGNFEYDADELDDLANEESDGDNDHEEEDNEDAGEKETEVQRYDLSEEEEEGVDYDDDDYEEEDNEDAEEKETEVQRYELSEEEEEDVDYDDDDDDNEDDDDDDLPKISHNYLVRNLRYGIPDDERDCKDDCNAENVELGSMEDFLGQYGSSNYFSTLSGHRKSRS